LPVSFRSVVLAGQPEPRRRESDPAHWLGSLGLKEWIFPTSLALLLALGLWSYRYRHIDIWILMGITSYVARFWTYHRWYDDALILLPIVTLFRIAKHGPSDHAEDVIAGVLLGVILLLMLAPGGLFLLRPPWNTVYVVGQVIVWILTLVFLLGQAQAESKMRTALAKVVSADEERHPNASSSSMSQGFDG
jgi:hypothetical protein